MKLARLHDWDLAPRDAAALQRDLAGRIDVARELDPARIHALAGVDISVKKREGGLAGRAAVVVMRPDFEIIETATHEAPITFPYVPGLLAFREGPLLQVAFEKLTTVPDVFLFDGQGLAHPRRLGIACHMGLWLERPTLGCGKTRLVGTHAQVGETKGDAAVLRDGADVIGTVLRTRARVAPVYTSPGHLCDVASANALVLATTTRYRLPEPIRAAHKLAGDF